MTSYLVYWYLFWYERKEETPSYTMVPIIKCIFFSSLFFSSFSLLITTITCHAQQCVQDHLLCVGVCGDQVNFFFVLFFFPFEQGWVTEIIPKSTIWVNFTQFSGISKFSGSVVSLS